jgi:hypothetical protein
VSHSFQLHPHVEAFLESAIGTPFPLCLVYHTTPVGHTSVHLFVLDSPLEESFAGLTGEEAVVVAGHLVSADGAELLQPVLRVRLLGLTDHSVLHRCPLLRGLFRVWGPGGLLEPTTSITAGLPSSAPVWLLLLPGLGLLTRKGGGGGQWQWGRGRHHHHLSSNSGTEKRSGRVETLVLVAWQHMILPSNGGGGMGRRAKQVLVSLQN